MNPATISALHVVRSLHPSGGGPSRTVVQLTDGLANEPGVVVTLLSQSFSGAPRVASCSERVDRRVVESLSRPSLLFGLPVRQELRRVAAWRLPSVVHNHGLWAPTSHWAAEFARRYRVPLICHPRGMLEPWAVNHNVLKKRLAMMLFQRRDLESAAVLIATSEEECESIRALGFRQPIAVIPNGVAAVPTPCGERLRSVRGTGPRTVLFLSRIHKQKGLLNLMQAWGSLRPKDWRLRLVGPNDAGHLDEIMAVARRAGISASVDYVGEVDGPEKSKEYHSADLFVLPTFSENFGVVVAEALAHGLPVVTTKGAPWRDLETYGCGWWIDTGVEPLVNALREAMLLSSAERAAMGERGRTYVRRYDWGDIARQTLAVYRWSLEGGLQPGCLRAK